ncbi:2-deoxy-D-gluconate 3-dehydrogenase [Umbelopsis sp. PMI_123]|nr:2-deoxy-D-gluconate 3-dehydrogenase [Umbelopsis sp. PMI_123]
MSSSHLALFSLEGKIAAVTGGTRGIGKAMAVALAEAGADIALLQRDLSNTAVRDEIRALGRKCEVLPLDISDHESCVKAIPAVLETMGDIDILVNNAGVQKRHKSVEFPNEDFDMVLQCNLKSVWTLSQAAGRHMVQKGSGKIITTASLLTFQGGINVPAYAAAKAGVGSVIKALANEWASQGVNVNGIAPGYIATDMNTALLQDENRCRQLMERIPQARFGTPEDFKGAVVYLASNASNYVNGEILVVDGGWMGR